MDSNETTHPPCIKLEGGSNLPTGPNQQGGEPTFGPRSTFMEADPAVDGHVAWLISDGPPPEGKTNGEMMNEILASLQASHSGLSEVLHALGGGLAVYAMDGDGRI